MNKEEILDTVKDVANKKISEETKKGLYLKSKSKGVLDAVQEKIVSRKLLVFLTATGLFVWSGLDPDVWGMIAW